MAKGSRVFTSNAALLDFAQDEYLSALSLRRASPKPKAGRTPSSVKFVWELDAAGELVPYQVVADGVSRWSLDGKLEEGHAVSWSMDADPDAPIALTMEAPGRLRLACERLTIERGRASRKKQKVRPLSTYTYFTLDGVGAPSARSLVAALSDLPDARLNPGGEPLADYAHELVLGERALAKVFYAHARAGGWLSISRAGATDDEWRRILRAPGRLANTGVAGPWEFFGSAAGWCALVDALP